MIIDFSPLKHNKSFRLLFMSMIAYVLCSQLYLVALPYQIYELTHSTLLVGLLSLCEFIPMLVMGLIGGAFADRFERKRIILITGFISIVCCTLLLINSLRADPSIVMLFIIGFVISGNGAVSRPAFGAILQAIVGPEGDFKAVSALNSFVINLGAIAGPALCGLIIAHLGFPTVFSCGLALYFFGFLTIWIMKCHSKVDRDHAPTSTFSSIREGIRYALSRQELMGSYIVDIVAMVFGMPNALFPALAQRFGGTSILGLLYAAPAIGAACISYFSGWTRTIRAYGKAVIISAFLWGIFIIGLGLTHHLIIGLIALALAGAADAVSGIFRTTLWNETIPNHIRGRLAGIEMVSYMSGPALGNTEAGLVASAFGVTASVLSGGLFCMVGVAACVWCFPKFWNYQSPLSENPQVDS